MTSSASRAVTATWPAVLTNDSSVLRALPRRELRRVGPFVFCDHFGPTQGMDVTPHPHVGLQTVTYLFSGEAVHTDSLGTRQTIRPGDVNWITAGRGVVHAERALEEGEPLHGVQTWIALPHAERAIEPSFAHIASSALPELTWKGARAKVLAGRLGDAASPVKTFVPVTFLDLTIEPESEVSMVVENDHILALYVAMGSVEIGGATVPARSIAPLSSDGATLVLRSKEGARALLFGGAAMADPTVIWWNFVVGSVAEGRELQAEWEAGRFPAIPEGLRGGP